MLIDTFGIITTLIIGGLAGWIASMLLGAGSGLIKNIIVGILGAFIGSFVFELVGLNADTTFVGNLIVATTGAVILLATAKLLT